LDDSILPPGRREIALSGREGGVMRIKISIWFVALVIALAPTMRLRGQAIATSQVSGVVTDQSGASVPGATVTMTQTNTGTTRTVTTSSKGSYTIPNLAVGPYELKVTKPGFTAYVQTGIVLQVSVNPTINVTLRVGAVSQQVTVQANANMVETENTSVGQVINSAQVQELPLNGRQVAQLITLAGAATTAGGSMGDENTNKNYGAGNPNMQNAVVTDAVAGGQGNTVNFVMDGGINNDPAFNLNSALPFPDAIQEFSVQTSSLPAKYGQNSTAAVNIVTKSGTNQFHGDAFEYVRNFMFNAREANAATRDSLKRNQFGGVIGGPIKRNKLFFFAGYQGTILRSNPTNNFRDVPTAAELAGDFSAVTQNASLCGLTPGVKLNQSNPNFPEFDSNNKFVPTSEYPTWQIAPLTQSILKYLPPAPTTGTVAQTACGQVTVPISQNLTDKQTIGRVDWNASTKSTVFVRYFIAINDQPVTWDQKDFLELNKMHTYERDQETTIGWTYTATSNLINSLHLTGNRDLNLRLSVPVPFGGSTANPSGLKGTGGDCTSNPNAPDCSIQMYSITDNYFPMVVGSSGFGASSTGGFGGFLGGATNPGYFNTTLFQVADDVDWIHGNHQIQFGFEYIHEVANTVNTRPDNGSLAFTGNALVDPSSPHGNGIAYADFEQGWITPSSFTQGNSLLDNDWKPYYGAYIQDNWHVRSNLSVSAGIRFEPYIQPKNTNCHVENFQLPAFVAQQHTKVYVNAPDGLFFPGDPGYPGCANSENHLNTWSPRVGIVWDPTGKGKTSIRAGFGLFNNAAELFNYNHSASNPPWGDILSASQNSSAVVPVYEPWAAYGAPDPFPAALKLSSTSFFPSGVTLTNQPINMPAPYSMQWNLSIQHQFGSWLLSANYIGDAGRHLQSGYQANPSIFVPGTPAGGQCTVGTGGHFVGGPFDGLSDGLPGNYPSADPCSTDRGVIPGDNVSNTQDRKYLSENAVNVSGQASPGGTADFGNLPQMEPYATSNYDALLLSANHRLSSNFNLLANYTWSHCLELPVQDQWQGAELFPVGTPISPSQPDFQYQKLAYHSCDSDVRQITNVSFIANTPKFSNRWMNAILGGWTASVIGGFQTGTYSLIGTGVDTSMTNQANLTYAAPSGSPEYVSNKGGFDALNSCTSTSCNFRVDWLSKAGFIPGSAMQIGTFASSWAQIENPDLFHVDTALSRSFQIREGQAIHIRWETFNLDNHVNLGSPQTTLTSGTFGQITGVAGGSAGNPRIMQFAMKYVF
jgi:hypothetical protein